MSKESEDLATHVEICSIRYQGIQDKFETVDARLNSIERNLLEIKDMINRQGDAKFKSVVAALGSVIVAFLGLLGYVIVHLK